jgi:CRISPR system Cascade subunit CasE
MIEKIMCPIGLTRILLAPDHPKTIQIISDPYVLHQEIYAALEKISHESRILYRVEASLDTYQRMIPSILIQHGFDDRIRTDSSLFSCGKIITKRVRLSLETGQSYYFRLRANPVKSVPSGLPGKRGKKIALKDESECRQWLEKTLSNQKMSLTTFECVREPYTTIRKRNRERGSSIELSGVSFNGVLCVHDPEQASKMLLQGIGRAKGFGFGLLSLAPIV